MPQPPRTRWRRVPMVDPGLKQTPDRVVVDGVLTLFDTGDVQIGNRFFGGNWLLGRWGADAIDFPFHGGHAWRDKHGRRLVIRTAGPDRQALVYEFSGLTPLFSGEWRQLVPQQV